MGFYSAPAMVIVLMILATGSEAFYRPATGLTELYANKDFMETLKWFFNLSDEPLEISQYHKNPECLTRPFSRKWMALRCWKEQGMEYLLQNRGYSYTLLG